MCSIVIEDALHFKPGQPVFATCWGKYFLDGQMGWPVFLPQGDHRGLLTGCTFGRSKPDTTWEALSVWGDFEPRAYDTRPFFPEEFNLALQ
jgi:hypothetical protein